MKSEPIRSGALLQFAGLFLSAAAIGMAFLIPAHLVDLLPKSLIVILSLPALYAYMALFVIGTVIRIKTRKKEAPKRVAGAGGATPQTFEITPAAARSIRESAPAARVMALAMYLSVLLLGLSALLLYIEIPRYLGTTRSAVMGFDGLVLVLLAAIYAIPGRRIERYAEMARDVTAREGLLHDLLAHQLTIWSFVGTVLIASTVMVTIGLALEIIGDIL
ncbi:MAG TPA: hypothetical protein VLV78_23550 [Thermoanaerobaculia bacterium]|nr:hypothetical protein [Thermoanaerobaculia bacterium]